MPVVNLGKTADSSPRHVWVVDADSGYRTVVQRILEGQGLRVTTCSGVRPFLSLYAPGRAHCLVIETTFPDGDGLAVQRELNSLGDLLPLIFVASNANVGMAVAAMKAGAADFLLKPIDPPALVEAVKGGLGRSRRYRALQEAVIAARRLQGLTIREREVLDLVVAGYSTKQISSQLHRVEKTIEFHRQNIMRKLGANNVAHLVRLVTTADHATALRNGNGHTPATGPRRV